MQSRYALHYYALRYFVAYLNLNNMYLQEREREERSTLESPLKKAKKNAISKESDTIEDIVVMDYAKPHRKPPIHNKEP